MLIIEVDAVYLVAPAQLKMRSCYMSGYLKYLKVTISFCFTVSLLNVLTLFACQKKYLSFFEQLTAQTATKVIQFFGLPAMQSNANIYLKNTVLVVNPECTAIFIMIIFSCLVAFYQTSLKSKIIGILAGLPIIFAVNLIRFVIMALLDRYRPVYLAYFPTSLWQAALIVMAVFMWMAWTISVAKHETKIARFFLNG
jgi:exosortase/archaeosortase family protein